MELIGLSKEEAIEILESAGCNFRISKEEGKYYILTRDYKSDRFNLEIEEGKVVSYTMG